MTTHRTAILASLLALALLAACTCTTSGTDFDKAEKEMQREHEWGQHWAAVMRRYREDERKEELLERQYAERYAGQVQPGVGCDVCPEECELYDLRPLEPEAFKRAFRHSVTELGSDDRKTRRFAWFDQVRLHCMAEAAKRQLRDPLFALMEAPESRDVRIYAAFGAASVGREKPAALAAFRRMTGDPDRDLAAEAAGMLEMFAAGMFQD